MVLLSLNKKKFLGCRTGHFFRSKIWFFLSILQKTTHTHKHRRNWTVGVLDINIYIGNILRSIFLFILFQVFLYIDINMRQWLSQFSTWTVAIRRLCKGVVPRHCLMVWTAWKIRSTLLICTCNSYLKISKQLKLQQVIFVKFNLNHHGLFIAVNCFLSFYLHRLKLFYAVLLFYF